MNTLHVNLNDNKMVKEICKTAYPEYRGRKFEVVFERSKISVRSYWYGGSKTYYKMVRLNDMAVVSFGDSHPFFNEAPEKYDPDCVEIPVGFVIVAHSIFCGRDMGLTIYSPDKPKFLENGDEELTKDEMNVLYSAYSLKSYYAGISDYRKQELKRYGLTGQEVDDIRQKLIDLGYMNKNKSISNKGKNVVSGMLDFKR